jgi:hypothetical protein
LRNVRTVSPFTLAHGDQPGRDHGPLTWFELALFHSLDEKPKHRGFIASEFHFGQVVPGNAERDSGKTIGNAIDNLPGANNDGFEHGVCPRPPRQIRLPREREQSHERMRGRIIAGHQKGGQRSVIAEALMIAVVTVDSLVLLAANGTIVGGVDAIGAMVVGGSRCLDGGVRRPSAKQSLQSHPC